MKTNVPGTTAFRPTIVAGPCMAESYSLLEDVASPLLSLSKRLGFDLIFKSSFDKANRSSISSYRGPGLDTAMKWFADLRSKFGIRILTDVHETNQVLPAGAVCDVLQIPAFLCRQTDLIVAAVRTGRSVNIKKGQFMAPHAMSLIVEKVRSACHESELPVQLMLTERGTTFGYGDLVVDMRSLAVMADLGVPVLFDITHSTQQPSTGGATSGALRQHAGVLARAAAGTGRIDGFFLEVHPEPRLAKSDADAQLSIRQAEQLIEATLPILSLGRTVAAADHVFCE